MNGRSFMLLIALIGVACCGSPSGSGLITGTSTPGWYAGTIAPDVEYKSMEGNQVSFKKVRQPVTLIAFTAPEGASCFALDPKVVNIANQVWDLRVTVAQFSLPASKCPHGPGYVEVRERRQVMTSPRQTNFGDYPAPMAVGSGRGRL